MPRFWARTPSWPKLAAMPGRSAIDATHESVPARAFFGGVGGGRGHDVAESGHAAPHVYDQHELRGLVAAEVPHPTRETGSGRAVTRDPAQLLDTAKTAPLPGRGPQLEQATTRKLGPGIGIGTATLALEARKCFVHMARPTADETSSQGVVAQTHEQGQGALHEHPAPGLVGAMRGQAGGEQNHRHTREDR